MSNNIISMLLDTPCSGEQARVFAAAKAEIERLRADLENTRAEAVLAVKAAQAAERERCASLCENWPTPDCGGWTLDGLSDAIRAGA